MFFFQRTTLWREKVEKITIKHITIVLARGVPWNFGASQERGKRRREEGSFFLVPWLTCRRKNHTTEGQQHFTRGPYTPKTFPRCGDAGQVGWLVHNLYCQLFTATKFRKRPLVCESLALVAQYSLIYHEHKNDLFLTLK